MTAQPFLNVSFKRVGGMRFLKLGRINLSWSVSSPEGAQRRPRTSRKRYSSAQVKRGVTLAYMRGVMMGWRIQHEVA